MAKNGRKNGRKNGKQDPASGVPALGVWVQSDQLRLGGALFKGLVPGGAPLCLIESVPTLTNPPFHKKRLTLLLSMQRHFADELRSAGYEVFYYGLGGELEALCEEGEKACLRDFVKRSGIQTLRAMEGVEYDAHRFVLGLEKELKTPVEVVPNDQFMIGKEDFKSWYEAAEESSVENFYRWRRLDTDLLVDDGEPVGGRWNYDADNRVSPTGKMKVPPLLTFAPDETTREVIDLVEERFGDHVGDCRDFSLPVTRADVEVWFDDFLEKRLRLYGMYQDAMLKDSPAMYHAYLSPYLNHGLIEAKGVLSRIAKVYAGGDIPINSAEGLIRQILGWREYVHGTYWMKMPGYRDENYLGFDKPVPQLMRDGQTHLKCLKHVIDQSRNDAYAHHIQRLMIVGNFALLVGVEPKALVRWFQEMYIDSAEWATLPNVMGVALYADGGGAFASKPYAASAHYINKMSDYCSGCHYRGKKRLGEKACPLNYLYWNFVGEFQGQLKKNPRMQNAIQMYRLKPEAERKLIASSSVKYLGKLEETGTDMRIKQPV